MGWKEKRKERKEWLKMAIRKSMTRKQKLGHHDTRRSKEVPEFTCPANTVLNYNLASNDQQKNQLDFLHQRLSGTQSDVMVTW